jgi:hypothetical protein
VSMVKRLKAASIDGNDTGFKIGNLHTPIYRLHYLHTLPLAIDNAKKSMLYY